MSGCNGYFDKSESTTSFNVSKSWVTGLEVPNTTETQEATGFRLAVTVVHEFVHQARTQEGLGSTKAEYGVEFGKKSYGITVDKSNAANFRTEIFKK